MTPLAKRRHPAHPPPILLSGRSTILFVTICVDRRRALLANAPAHELIVRGWREAQAWKVGRYVVMPEHVHFFCAPFDQNFTLKNWMTFWRNAFTRAWPLAGDKPIWQPDYWDTQLRRGESYAAKWEYVRQNPVRRGLVSNHDDWPYQGELEVLPWLEG
jgi:putative transposase